MTERQSTDDIVIDRILHWSILDISSFRGADGDTYHYVVVAKVRERLAVSKLVMQWFCMEKFNIKNLNELEDKQQ
jgi:hypothetical protein